MSIVSGVAARGLKSFTPAFRRRWLRHIRKLVREDLDSHSQLYFEWKRLDPKKAFRFLLEEADFASLKSEEASLIVELREAAPNDARAMNRLRAVASLRSPVGREAQRELGSLDPKQLTVNVRRWAKRWRQERNRDALTNLYDYYLLKRITVSTR